jgi:hypothetical protein
MTAVILNMILAKVTNRGWRINKGRINKGRPTNIRGWTLTKGGKILTRWESEDKVSSVLKLIPNSCS